MPVMLSFRNRAATVLALCALPLLAAASATAQPDSRFVADAAGKSRFTVDGKPFLVLGIQLNNSSGFPGPFHELAPAIARSGANTVMAPIGWDTVEPEEGHFDFSVVDAMIAEARTQQVRLAFLWFGTWKNAKMSYAPAWVKRDTTRFARVIDGEGRAIDVLSPISAQSEQADARAFAALMAHIKAVDARQRTVVMVQVENEAGTLGADRDHSAAAQALYEQPVPPAMNPPSSGSWSAVYGARAPEAFMAYYTARYIGGVAAAGRRAYDLPLYVNVWPRQQPGLLRPGESSPSGGAVSWLLPQWKALAPAIDVVGVDNYDTNIAPYTQIAKAYDIPGNPLYVPETGGTMAHARHAFWTLSQPYAVGISKFGIDTGFGLDGSGAAASEKVEPIALDYRLLRDAAPFLLPLRDSGHVRAAIEEDGMANVPMAFDGYDAVARFGPVRDGYGGPRGQGNADVSGRVIVAQAGADRFLLTGASANIVFAPKLGTAGHVELLRVEQGHFCDGQWIVERTLNGDETAFGLILPPEGASLMVTVQTVP